MSDKSSFPTRDGIATGKANERQMLERGGMSNEGFRTDLRDNPDGSTTMLRTRGGSPEFSTVAAQRPLDGQPVARGFVAHAFGKSYGALFDPYTLAIEDKRFSIRFATYHVSSVAASAYAPRNWLDVWSWDGATMRVNGQLAKTFFPFRFPAAVLQAMPYLRTWPSAPIYGDKWQNSDFPKRIYAVGPESVGIATDPRWASVIAPLKLSPEAPRSENKALVCGPVINRSTHEATLAQLYFTGEAWDSLVGGWAYSSTKVAMLLTPPYLQATNSSAAVEMERPILVSAGTSSGSMSTDTMLPGGATLGVIGMPVHSTNVPYARSGLTGNPGLHKVVWPWTDVLTGAIQGEVKAIYDRVTYAKSEASTETQYGVTLSYSASNSKIWDSRDEQHWQKSYTHQFADSVNNSNGSDIGGNTTTLWWGQHVASGWDPSQLGSARGPGGKLIDAYPIAGSSVTDRAYEEQSGSFVVTSAAGDLVHVAFSRSRSEGQGAVIAPKDLDYYDAYFLPGPGYGAGYVHIYYYAGSGLGAYSGAAVHKLYVSPASDITPAWENYKSLGGGLQDPSAVDDINAMYDAGVSGYMGQTLYDSEDSDGHSARLYYSASTNPSVTLDDLALTWSTRDFLLHDETNGVYITVDGHFAATKSYGASASATLTVVLNIETPWGSGSKVLYDLDYTYTDMLPEEEIGSTGKYAIPSPKIMAVFAPKHREQGTFPGAAYVTQDEVGNGAVPAILVNFVLVLEPYSFIGSAETDGQIHLVPVNLLEMLYAYVFSRKYGIDPYQRYPVSDTAAFNTIMAGLFNVQHHIQFRDGAMDEWLIGLGLPYFTEHKTELSRV